MAATARGREPRGERHASSACLRRPAPRRRPPSSSCLWLLLLLGLLQQHHLVDAADVPFSCSKPDMNDGQTYVVAAGTYTCSSVLLVHGNSKLVFQDQNINLVIPGMVIEDGGVVEIGTEAQPIAAGTINIKVYGAWLDPCISSPNNHYATEYLFCPGTSAYCPSAPSCGTTGVNCNGNYLAINGPSCGGAYGGKVIAVGSGGTLDIHGKKGVPKFFPGLRALNITGAPEPNPSDWRGDTSWAILTATLYANQGAQCIQTDRTLRGWQVGDEVVITTTDFEPYHNDRITLVACPASVSSCASGLCVPALQYTHRGGYLKTSNGVEVGQAASARIGLVSRRINIVAIGNTTAQDPFPVGPYNYYGVHILVRGGATAFRMEGAKVQYGGQGGLLGRYAVHFHYLGLNGAQGMYLHGNAIVDSFTRATVVHETRYAIVSENVAHRSIGHMFYLENGDETMNAFVNNLAAEAISGTDFGVFQSKLSPSLAPGIHEAFDCTKPTLFWIPSPHNVFIGNQAIGAFCLGAAYWSFGTVRPRRPNPPGTPAMGFPLEGSPFANQLVGYIAFRDNHAASSTFCMHNEGSTAVNPDGIYPPGPGTNMVCIPNPRSAGRSWTPLDPSGIGTMEPITTPNGVGPKSMQVVENFQCVRAHSTQSFGSIWMRDFPAALVGAIAVDNLSRGPTLVSGGSPTAGSGAGYNGFIMNLTSVGISAFFPCVTVCCNVFDRANGMWWPSDAVSLQRSAANFYDGPVHLARLHVENYTDGLRYPFCGKEPIGCDVQPCREAEFCKASSVWWLQGPSVAMSWMLPNSQYYPVTFTSRDFSFTNVTNRHLALAPWEKLVRTLGDLPYVDIGHANLLTVVQDIDGTLTGARGSQAQPVISTTSTRFLRPPQWRIECLSSETCGISSSVYASIFLQPLTSTSLFNGNAADQQRDSMNYWNQYTSSNQNVALYRLSLGANETSIPGLGLFDVNRPIADQTAWGSLLVNTSTALVFTRPLQVWTVFFTNLELGDWVELVVPVKPGGQVTVLHGFSGGFDMPRIFYNSGITPASETLTPNANGVVRTRVTATYPLKSGECWLPGVCGGAYPQCTFTGVPYTDVAPGTAAQLNEACRIGREYAAEGQDYLPPTAAPNQPFFVGVSIQGDLDDTFDWTRLTQETRPFGAELAAKDFVFVTPDPACTYPAKTPADAPAPNLSLCPTDWAKYGAVTRGNPLWAEMTKFYCNRWDYNTTSGLGGTQGSCSLGSTPVPNDVCGPGSSLTPLEPLPPPQPTRYQQPGACPLPAGDPTLDPDNVLLPLSLSWVQQTPWDPTRPVYVSNHSWTGGWSMLPSRGYGCNIGGWCPYACKAPYYETQWDNAWAGSAYWSLYTGGSTPSFTGFGRRYPQPNGPCMGGQQGIYCNDTGKLQLTAPSSGAPQNFTTMCTRGPDVVFVDNRTPWQITSCRKVLPEDYMGIPTLYQPSTNSSFPTVKRGPPSAANPRVQVPQYYTDGAGVYGVSPGFKQYFTIPQKSSSSPPCLDPWCQLVRYRPSTGNNNSAVVGQDYTPYEVDVSNTDMTGTFTVSLRVTSVASATGFPIAGKLSASYDTALGNPGYGIRIWDTRGELACEGYWDGGPPTKNDCSTYCLGQDCANPACNPQQTNAAASDACYNYPPRGAAGPGPYVKPVLKSYGVVQSYAVAACYVVFPGNPGTGKIRIELYPLP